MIKSIFIISFLTVLYSVGNSQDNIGANEKCTNNETSITGNIFMGELLLSEGRVFLITNSKSLTATSKKSEVINGKFSFEGIDLSDYSLYVIPNQNYDFFYFPKYLPTYLGDVISWENAVLNDNKLSGQEVEIHLNKYTKPFYGHGKISGKIRYDRSYGGNRFIPVSILLLNSEQVPMDFKIANEQDGSFLFDYLPIGKYFIHPEVPGFLTEDIEIIVKARNNNRVDFRINDNSIKQELVDDSIIPIISHNGLRFSIDKFNKEPIVCALTDLSGRIIVKEKFLSNDIFINTSNFATGIYLLRARTFSSSIVKTLKVYINNN